MASRLLFLPSPYLPPVAYRGLLASLQRIGYATELADAAEPRSGLDLVERYRVLASTTQVLVAHSNAGYVAPLVRAGSPEGPAVIFVDAALPPASGSTRLAPAAFREQLADLADHDGVLPRWTRWWPRESLAEVIPDDRFDEIDASCPRVPLAYLDSSVTAPDGWATGPNAYLAFGPEAYADEIAFATSRGWPVEIGPGRHLHFLVDPDGVAAAVDRLVQALR